MQVGLAKAHGHALADLRMPAGDQAARMLQASGLNVSIVVDEPPEGVRAAPGRVWRQEPGSGAVIDEGETVTIWARN